MGKETIRYVTLMTEAGEKIRGKEKVWQDYPRPQLKREKWLNLNGIWELDGKSVRVPFPPEAALAEYEGQVQDHMVYRRRFMLPEGFVQPEECALPEGFAQSDGFAGGRVLLHFGAVDQIAEVCLNGRYVDRHEGGYLPFSFDVTECLKAGEENLLEVRVTDELDRDFPYGKQRRDRGGMWYTPISGIWQSVWLEPVPERYVEQIRITPDRQGIKLEIQIRGEHSPKEHCQGKHSPEDRRQEEDSQVTCRQEELSPEKEITIFLHNGETYTLPTKEENLYIDLTKIKTKDGSSYEPRLWTTEDPYLYKIAVKVGEDRVESYFALRTISIETIGGINRVCLNGEPVFLHGVLDQGYFSDGIFTPAEEAEYERDILRMKELGFNMLRKHIKIEPECFYYYCDVHGMLVMQDMVSNGYYDYYRDTVLPTIGVTRRRDSGRGMSERQKRLFEEHMLETISHLYNHPSVIAYTIFNEGWGQFDSDRLYTAAKEADPSRLYDSTSGWFTRKLNDFDSVHIYFTPKKPVPRKRPMFLSEFGGYSYGVPEHVFARKVYGYGACENEDALFQRIYDRYAQLVFPYVGKGLCGSVYTQVSDVEDEINGFFTYDRRVCKVSPEQMGRIAEKIRRELEAACRE